MKKVINLTPHVVNVYDLSNNPVCDIPVSGMPIPRCHQDQVVVGIIDNITITRQSFGDVENLPAPVPDVYYVVTRMVADAMPERGDLLVPGPLVRDSQGNPCGCRGLAVVGPWKRSATATFGKYKPVEAYVAELTDIETYKFAFRNGYGASVIRGPRTYGGEEGTWELAVLKQGSICDKTPITDDVIGGITDDEVIELLQRIEAL